MAKASRESEVVVLGRAKAAFRQAGLTTASSARDIAAVYDRPAKRITWVSFGPESTHRLLSSKLHQKGRRMGTVESLLTIVPPPPESVPALRGFFAVLIGDSPSVRWLPAVEHAAVLLAPDEDKAELFFAVAVDPRSRSVTLYRADLTALSIPFSLFPPSGDGRHPDFSRPRVTDYGRTIAFGEYEAAGDAILYETDAEYRTKLYAQRRETERTFGASLRRLRMQRRLTQSDFPGVTAKTVARIERGEVAKPHGKTLRTLAEALGVDEPEIERY